MGESPEYVRRAAPTSFCSNAEPEGSDNPGLEVPTRRAGDVHGRQNGACSFQEQVTGGGQGDAAWVTIEESDAKLHLELPNLSREAGLRHEQSLGGTREAPFLGNHDEVAKVTNFHADVLLVRAYPRSIVHVASDFYAWTPSIRDRRVD
jgi:hypothetical protein